MIAGVPTEVFDSIETATSTDAPLVIAPGLGATIHTNAPMLDMISRDGHRVISLNHPRSERIELSEDDAKAAAEFYRIEAQKASNLLELIDKTCPGEKVRAAAFSEGALNIMIAVYLHPEKFKSIVLISPAGLLGPRHTFGIGLISLAHRFFKQKRFAEQHGTPSRDTFSAESEFPELAEEEDAMFDYVSDAWKEDEAAAHGQSAWQSAQELWAIGHMRIDSLIAFARAAGIKVAVITSADDLIFPSEKVAERMPADSLDGFMTVRGAHAPHYSARVMNYLFDLLDKK